MLACLRRGCLPLAGFFLLAMGLADEALAQRATNDLPLPPGEIITGSIFRGNGTFVPSIETGANANTYLNSVPPTESFTPSAGARVVRTSVPTQYVRAYTNGVTSPIGRFLAGSNTIRGLNAEEIRDVLALPYLPDSLTIVLVPAGTCMIVGDAAPILGHFRANPPNIPTAGPWGHGGVPQERLIGVSSDPGCANAQFVPAEDYINLQLIGDAALSYRPRAGGGNALAVATALDTGPFPELFTDMDSIYNSLDLINVGGGATLHSALVQLGGEPYAEIPTVEIASARMFLGTVHDEMRLDRAASRTGEPPFRQWVTGFGGSGGIDGSGDLHGINYSMGGAAGGIEHRFGPALLAGVAVGYARSNYDADQISGSGSIDTGSGGLYASYAPGNWYVDGLLGYGFSDGSLDRSIVFPGVARRASGDPNANAFLSSIETGYSIVLGRSTMVTPLAALQGIVIFQNDLSETGAGAINLLVEDKNTSSAQSLLGAELTQALPVGLGAPLLLKLRAGWGHELADVSRSFTAGFEGLPGATTFTVDGVNAPRDVAVIELLASLTVRQSFDLYLRYDGAFANDASTQGGSAGLRFVF
jgi:outer membrane autotransporter protein